MNEYLMSQARDMLNTFCQFRFHILAILLLCLAHGAVGADLPPDAAKLVMQSEAEITKVRTELVKDLNKSLVKYTRAGNLDAANAIKAVIERTSAEVDGATDLLGDSTAIRGISVRGDTEQLWDNKSAIPLTTGAHTLSFSLKLPKPTKTIFLRAAKAYGSERVVLSIDGKGDMKMAHEYAVTLPSARDVVKVLGTHAGSNDPFSYGPLQYKINATDEWTDIPTQNLAPVK